MIQPYQTMLAEGRVLDDSVHLRAAINWLCRAQDAAEGGGLSYGYMIGKGWLPAYPETTGYCIPTFLTYSKLAIDVEYQARAQRMADWTIHVQMPSGGIPGGYFCRGNPSPAMSFDTGQVIHGWCALYEITKESRLLEAAMRAGDWLVNHQLKDGPWEDTSPGRSEPTRFAFNARTSSSLLYLSRISGYERFTESALRNLDWTLSLQNANGWFSSAGFSPRELPLTHTIAYILEGLLRSWAFASDPLFVLSVTRCNEPLLEFFLRESYLPAYFDENWWPFGHFECVTGCAQMALVWLFLNQIEQDDRLMVAASRMLTRLKKWQLDSYCEEINGGLPGSIPMGGAYETFSLPNWGTKFFCDALLASMNTLRLAS